MPVAYLLFINLVSYQGLERKWTNPESINIHAAWHAINDRALRLTFLCFLSQVYIRPGCIFHSYPAWFMAMAIFSLDLVQDLSHFGLLSYSLRALNPFNTTTNKTTAVNWGNWKPVLQLSHGELHLVRREACFNQHYGTRNLTVLRWRAGGQYITFQSQAILNSSNI